MVNNLKIKIASSLDAKQMSQLHQLCFNDGWDEQSFSNLLNNKNTIGFIVQIANHTPDIVALILLSHILDEAEILTICTAPDQRKQSIATALLQYAMTYLKQKNCQKIFLEVAIDNISAQKLYKRLGFLKMGARKNYYFNKEQQKYIDAVVLYYNFCYNANSTK